MHGSEPTPTEGEESIARVPDAVVTDLVSDDRCRQVLACLAEAEDEMPVDDLAREVVARERDVDPSAVKDDTVRRIREDIFQRHLPKLTPTGLVSYDSMLGTVELDTSDERVLAEVA